MPTCSSVSLQSMFLFFLLKGAVFEMWDVSSTLHCNLTSVCACLSSYKPCPYIIPVVQVGAWCQRAARCCLLVWLWYLFRYALLLRGHKEYMLGLAGIDLKGKPMSLSDLCRLWWIERLLFVLLGNAALSCNVSLFSKAQWKCYPRNLVFSQIWRKKVSLGTKLTSSGVIWGTLFVTFTTVNYFICIALVDCINW